MSENEQGGAGRREVAYRVFAAEYEDSDLSYSESDEERAPNYVITPSGARVNRLFVVGVLTEVETVSEDVLRARVVDPTGAFVLYAGQYQPDEQAFLERAEPPMFVAVTGKARTFEPEDSNEVYSSIRPESINEVDAETRDRWTVQAAEQTLSRVDTMATALTTGLDGESLADGLRERGVDEGLAAGIPLALDHYRTTPRYLAALRGMTLDAARVVAGERDEIDGLSVRPDASGEVTAEELVGTASDVDASPAEVGAVGTDAGTGDAGGDTAEDVDGEPGTAVGTADSGDADAGTDETDTKSPEIESDPADTTATVGDADGGETTGQVDTADAVDGSADEAGETDDLGDFEPGEFDLDEETREQVEAEYGTEFQSGTEVDEPGEAEIETPDLEDADAATSEQNTEAVETADGTAEPPGDIEAGADGGEQEMDESEVHGGEQETDESEVHGGEQETDESEDGDGKNAEESEDEDGPEDREAALLDVMAELDDGNGADREAVLSRMAERYGLAEDKVEDAIEEALMGGKCYEPDDTSLKPI